MSASCIKHATCSELYKHDELQSPCHFLLYEMAILFYLLTVNRMIIIQLNKLDHTPVAAYWYFTSLFPMSNDSITTTKDMIQWFDMLHVLG